MIIVKDPNARLDFSFDWSSWLADSEVISNATVTSTQAGITIDSQDHTGQRVTAWLSGGTTGDKYTLTCHIVTNQGREDERSYRVDVAQR